MTKGRPNILVLMSDEHARRIMGAYGDKIVETPNLDRLAQQSLIFDAAYTASPICVPARAALATGRPVHTTGHWDNAHPYEGHPRSWTHHLRDAGFRVESIGKLHYRDEMSDTGFSLQTLPMHVANGEGDITGSLRRPPPIRSGSRALAQRLGPGETDYTQYDRSVRNAAINRLNLASERNEDGLVLLVSFVSPHFPLIAPQAFYDLYRGRGLQPRQVKPGLCAQHPWLEALRKSYVYDNFSSEGRTEALRSYYGLVSFLDDNVGAVLRALETGSLHDKTSIIYCSDHGDNLGENGLWGKSTFFEDSVGVPLMVKMPGMSTGKRIATPVCLTDLFPTLLDISGLDDDGACFGRRSLFDIAAEPYDPERCILSQYHAAGSPSGAFMLRRGRYKLIHYVGFRPQLFDLDSDPSEQIDLGSDPAFTRIRESLMTELLERVDPEEIDRQAHTAQVELLEQYGGEDHVQRQKTAFSATPAPSV